MATWTKSVVRETSLACGLKTSRPPETILIPGRRGVGPSRSRGKSRTIVEDRSNPLGQVPLVKVGGMLFCATQPIFPEYLSLKTAAIPTSGHPAKAVDANERLKPRNRKNILFPSNLANPPLIINTFSRVSNKHPQETRLSLVHLMLTSNVFTTIIDNKYFTLKPNDQLGL